jgi:flavin-dependent dehydrogenase
MFPRSWCLLSYVAVFALLLSLSESFVTTRKSPLYSHSHIDPLRGRCSSSHSSGSHTGARQSILRVSERTILEFERSWARQKERKESGEEGGAGGQASIDGLIGLDRAWEKLRNGGWKEPPFEVVTNRNEETKRLSKEEHAASFEVAVCGGTLGIFYALALQKRGIKTVVIERGRIAGRPQEWNISGKELNVFIRLGIFTKEEIDSVTAIEFNPVRVGFKTDSSAQANTIKKGEAGYQFELYTRDVLNLGIYPNKLIALAKQKFLGLGGHTMEGTALRKIEIYDNIASLQVKNSSSSSTSTEEGEVHIHSRVVVDCMGNGSPISKQIRGPVEPDGVCIVVGGCAKGFDPVNNTYSDLIYTDSPITYGMGDGKDTALQYFWEAFPTGSYASERTTYLFTYLDAKPQRPSVSDIYDSYWDLLPRYQGVPLEELEFQRLLYGLFPTYRESPLQSPYDRLLAVGDASGIQSPLSFGGFGSLTRHLDRVVSALEEALSISGSRDKDGGDGDDGDDDDVLLRADQLSRINSYQPNLSAAWMFQRSMSCPVGSDPSSGLIVGILSNSFSSMEKLGDPVMRPFLQDVLQFIPLLRTLTLAGAQDLLTPLKIVPHVGLAAMGDFFVHFYNMAWYTLCYRWLGKGVQKRAREEPSRVKAWRMRRQVEAWKFGAGLDFDDDH